MSVIKIGFVLVFIFSLLLSSYAQRRIINGSPVKSAKKFVVYLLKAPSSPQKYDEWLCGGALVSAEYVITSAACVQDVQHFYVIAGYNKYVPMEMVQLDQCTREKKKKVVFICAPKHYDLVYERIEKWSNIDIAVVKVESPYDFNDKSYESLCSYIPGIISVNYEHKYQAPGVDTLMFGWGHAEVWRSPNDGAKYNQEELHYASSSILDKKQCKAAYTRFAKMDYIIDKYMICTLEPGNFNDAGELIKHTQLQYVDGCVTRMQRQRGFRGRPCAEPEPRRRDYYNDRNDKSRRDAMGVNQTVDPKRSGICQNDHGGPLVTWVGSREILIGVASVFRVNAKSKCEGPFLFTSTQCNGAFLDCILNSKTGRRGSCDAPPEIRGFDKYEREISWKGHPDGPAENEIEQSDQQPLRMQPSLTIQQPRNPLLPEEQSVEQQSKEQQFLERQLPEQQSVEQQKVERQLVEQQLSELQLKELQLPKQQPVERQRPEQQLPERQLPERQFPVQKVTVHQLPEQQVSEQQSSDSDVQLSELLSPDVQLPALPLPRQPPLWQLLDQQTNKQQTAKQQLPEQQSVEQKIPDQQFDRAISNDEQSAAEPYDSRIEFTPE